MEFQLQLKNLAERVQQQKDQTGTEEATKTAFVLPFFHLLGYDIFNPSEVVPEFIADVGLKKGEKVDYAIFQEGNPILIVECKHWSENLDGHNAQLSRYFHVTKARFALLTNGVAYQFYSDLEAANKMDEKPFLEFDITKLKETTIGEISKFHKANFDLHKIINSASSLKYVKEIKKVLGIEFENPSAEFVRHFASRSYTGKLTKNVKEQFEELVKKALNQFISEKVNDRLTSALSKEFEQQEEEYEEEVEESKIVTTEEELEGFQIVKAILRKNIPLDRISARDTQSYFGVLLDNNNRKPICRLHFNGSKNYIGLFDENKSETKYPLESLEEIYNFEEQIRATAQIYM